MAQHENVALSTGMRIFFADPHSPWQRGSNENTNGLLRQYSLKGTSLSGFDQADLERRWTRRRRASTSACCWPSRPV
jgi:IS30 family transposase